jgi:hypothetical protein
MDRKTQRLCLFVTACSLTGVILGGTSSRAEIHQCLASDLPADHCLTEDPFMKTLEGMSAGLVAGAGASLGAAWQLYQKDT